MSDPQDTRESIEKRVAQKKRRVEQAHLEKGRLKYFIWLAFLTWPIGLVWSFWIALYIFFGWLTFWGVGYYLNYFHIRDANAQQRDAERDLEAHDERFGSAPRST